MKKRLITLNQIASAIVSSGRVTRLIVHGEQYSMSNLPPMDGTLGRVIFLYKELTRRFGPPVGETDGNSGLHMFIWTCPGYHSVSSLIEYLRTEGFEMTTMVPTNCVAPIADAHYLELNGPKRKFRFWHLAVALTAAAVALFFALR